jgi:hypothetical protein
MMVSVRKLYNERTHKYKQLLLLDDKEFLEELISIVKASGDEFLKSLDKKKIEFIPISKHPKFLEKKDTSIKLWNLIIDKTQGRAPMSIHETMIIPSKIQLIGRMLSRLNMRIFTTDKDIYLLLNCYRSLFEINYRFILPHFKVILKNDKHIDWSDIHNSIIELDPKDPELKKLIKSMNGNLRNAIAHESYYLEKHKFYWIKEDNTKEEYPIDKISDKNIDLYLLLCALYYGFSKCHIDFQIKTYKSWPVSKLRERIAQIQFDNA